MPDLTFRASKDDFADAVAWAAKTLPTKPLQPVLAGLCLAGMDTSLTISAYDQEMSGQVQIAADVSEPGSALVSGRLLASIAQSLPNKPVEFTCDGSRAALACGKAKFTLPTMDIDTYPVLPILPDVTGTVDAEVFAEAVAQVAVAASKDASPANLTGVRMEIDGAKVKIVATNRFRMAIKEFDWDPAEQDVSATVLVPAKTLAEAAKTGHDGPDVHLSLGDGSLFGIRGAARRTTTRLLDADFPDYMALLPKKYTAIAVVGAQELSDAVKRVGLMCEERDGKVRLQLDDDGLKLASSAAAIGDAQEDVDAEFTGKPLTIAFNPGYLCDGLAVLHTERLTIGFTAPNRPAVLQATSEPLKVGGPLTIPHTPFMYVLMPMRI